MKLPPTITGVLLSREKRFTAHVRLDDGQIVKAHCPNTGSMRGCLFPGAPVILSVAAGKKRTLPYTWEMIQGPGGLISVHTHRANQVAGEALMGQSPFVEALAQVRAEVPLATGRCDFHGIDKQGKPIWVEVKSVSLLDDLGHYTFPDSVTDRGRRHLLDLKDRLAVGDRAACWFLLMRNDGKGFAPAAHLDPKYAQTFNEVRRAGVEIWVNHVTLSRSEMCLGPKEPLAPDNP